MRTSVVPIDAHVHFHRRVRVEPTLNAAARNFRAAAAQSRRPLGALLLAQTRGERAFEWIRDQGLVGAWTVERAAGERQSLWLTRGADSLLAVCGRQIEAEPGLEVLALGTDAELEDGAGLEETLERVREQNGLPVLPWGFGKWLGTRGETVRRVLAAAGNRELWVGDNGGRLRVLRRPRLLDDAERRGMRVLPGTDPFPFGADYERAGSFGCLLSVTVNPERPWQSIVTSLRASSGSPPGYGRASGLVRFAVYQTRIQLHSRTEARR